MQENTVEYSKKGNRIVEFMMKKNVYATQEINIFQYFCVCHQNKIIH